MNSSLYNALIGIAIDNAAGKIGTGDVLTQLKGITNLYTGRIPVILDKNATLSNETTSFQSFVMENVFLPGNNFTLKQFLQLHDNSFLAINSDGDARHYNNNLVLSSALPFPYATAVTEEYTNPGRSDAIPYSVLSGSVIVSGSVVLLPQPNEHVVQMYKWENARWSYITTIGTVASNGNTSGLLDTPTAVSGYFDTTLSKFIIYISCLGNASNGQPSFIKKFEVTITGTKVDKGEVLKSTVANGGLLEHGEVKNITALKAYEDGRLALLSQTNSEFGIMNMNTTVTFPDPVPLIVIKGDIQDLPYNDKIVSPNVFCVLGTKTLVGDSRGHLAELKEDYTGIRIHIGKTQPAVATSYPLDFTSITDMLLTTNSLYFIAGGDLYKTNFPYIQEETITYQISGILYPVEMAGVYGLDCYGTVLIQLDSMAEIPIEQACCDSIPLGTTVKIKVVRSVEQVIEKPISEVPEAVLILKI